MIKKPHQQQHTSGIRRFPSMEVDIGGIPLGGNNPIRLQSMTNTRPEDVAGTVAQCIRIFEAGADYVRLSVPTKESVAAFEQVRRELRAAGFERPLVADIHFRPELALMVAPTAAKVRINPGNYTDRPRNGQKEWSAAAYQQELDNIRDRIAPLLQRCREHGTAIRIGTNFGSLSQRIIHRYGNTPEGMVQSTLEFLDIFEDLGFYQTVISLKASNPLVMVNAYRLMVARMLERGMRYPLHLGVTEAGAGENGRIKSALGMATLLQEGIGDTIRVSLTEAPEREIPFARRLATPYQEAFTGSTGRDQQFSLQPFAATPGLPPALPGGHKAVVIAGADTVVVSQEKVISHPQAPASSLPQETVSAPDLLALASTGQRSGTMQPQEGFLLPADKWPESMEHDVFPLFEAVPQQEDRAALHPGFNFIALQALPGEEALQALKEIPGPVLIPLLSKGFPASGLEQLHGKLEAHGVKAAIIPKQEFDLEEEDSLIVQLAAGFGSLLLQRKVHGLWVTAARLKTGNPLLLTYGLLQAAGLRITRTEFISCPTCARTSFDLEQVLEQARQQCAHLPGLKIAIMGCVVNGPGEMADADFGILGTPTGKVHIYQGSKPLLKNLQPGEAVSRLRAILEEKGLWRLG
jgi:(E)-4-hydroxy-3-methylbut-2-enyl-diphosphate synthase